MQSQSLYLIWGEHGVTVQVNLLGSFEARTATSELLAFPTIKTKALFAFLALTPEQSHSREKLSELFWGEAGDQRARANLRQTLTRVEDRKFKPHLSRISKVS
jgi:DNA-binding SARP family transcriptional activator